MDPWTRPLTPEEQRRIDAARLKCFVLYEGRLTPHRSCGIALAETFGLATPPYQALRKGGLTGEGECGSVVAGRLVLGQLLGDPDPTGGATPALLAASAWYQERWRQRLDRGAVRDSIVCNDLTGQFAEFRSPARLSFCIALASEVAALVAEALVRSGQPLAISAIAGVEVAPPGGWPT